MEQNIILTHSSLSVAYQPVESVVSGASHRAGGDFEFHWLGLHLLISLMAVKIPSHDHHVISCPHAMTPKALENFMDVSILSSLQQADWRMYCLMPLQSSHSQTNDFRLVTTAN